VRHDVSQGHVIFGVTFEQIAAVIHDTPSTSTPDVPGHRLDHTGNNI
jgi:hypothetical protein